MVCIAGTTCSRIVRCIVIGIRISVRRYVCIRISIGIGISIRVCIGISRYISVATAPRICCCISVSISVGVRISVRTCYCRGTCNFWGIKYLYQYPEKDFRKI